jgi:hypothetical protein
MLMKPDRKNAATLIVSRNSAKPMQAAEIEGAEDMDPKVAAAEEMMQAWESKDPRAFAEALTAFIDMCSYAESEEEA